MSPSFFENFNDIFNKRDTQKDYGVSKLSIELARNLIDLLRGRFIDTSKKMSGFVFPVELDIETVSGTPEDSEIEDQAVIPAREEETKELEETESIEEYTREFEKSLPEPEIDEAEQPEETSEFIQNKAQKRKTKESISRESDFVRKDKIDLSRLSCLYIEDQVDSQILFKVQLKELQEI